MMKLIGPKRGTAALQVAAKIFHRPNMVLQYVPTTSIFLRQRKLQIRNTSQWSSLAHLNNKHYSELMKRKGLFYSSIASNRVRTLMTTTNPSCSKCSRDLQKLKYVYNFFFLTIFDV